MAKEILLLLCIPLMLAFIAVMVAATVAIYLESIRPHLMKISDAKERKAKITGISWSVDIDREQRSSVKDGYRQRA